LMEHCQLFRFVMMQQPEKPVSSSSSSPFHSFFLPSKSIYKSLDFSLKV
jgi:hypothetical protein